METKYVCASCLEDEGLQQLTERFGITGRCTYCRSDFITKVIALEKVVWEMKTHISSEWVEAQNRDIPEESFDEFQQRCYNAKRLFKQIEFSVSNTELMSDLLYYFDRYDWCKIPAANCSESIKWADAWDTFKRCVKHERRYTFWQAAPIASDRASRQAPGTSSILFKIKTLLNKTDLVTTVRPKTPIWRFQILKADESPNVPHRFTSPPIKNALTPNRMSPAGVPMFYGADDFETAIRELVNPCLNENEGKVAIGVQFQTVRRLNILDLTLIPKFSYFKADERGQKAIVEFLREFADDLSTPISEKQQQIEYIPTQVFTEFVKFMMKSPNGGAIHGIRYSSSRTLRPCWVIFANQQQCLNQNSDSVSTQRMRDSKQLLSYVPNSQKIVNLPWINELYPKNWATS